MKRRRRFGILDNDLLMLTESIDIVRKLPSTLKLSLIRKMVISNFFFNDYVIKQNEPIDSFYIVKNGSFEVNYNRITESQLGINLEYFIEYQNVIKDHFSTNRKYEIDGKLKTKDKNKIFLFGKGEIFGDIEWYLNINKSLFNVICNESTGEIVTISRTDIENILNKFIDNIKNQAKIKLNYFKNLLENIKKNRKKRFTNKISLMGINISNVFDVYNKSLINKREKSNKLLYSRNISDNFFQTQFKKDKRKLNCNLSEIYSKSIENKSIKIKNKKIHKKKLTLLTDRLPSSKERSSDFSKQKKLNKSRSIGDILTDIYSKYDKKKNQKFYTKNTIKLKKTRLKKSSSDNYIPFNQKKDLNQKKKTLIFNFCLNNKGEENLIFPEFMKDEINISRNNMNSISSSKMENSLSFGLDKNFFKDKDIFNNLLKKKYKFIRCNSAQKIIKSN